MVEETHVRTCPLCEATCGLEIQVIDGAVTRIRGDQKDVFSKGFLCPKGTALGRFHDDPDRLRRPMIKRDGQHEPATWDEAFEHIATHMLPALDRTDHQSAGIYLGNPGVHSLDIMLYGKSVTLGLRAPHIFSASTVDQRPREIACGLLYGSPFTTPVPDIDRTDFLVLLGANPVVSNGSLATAPDWPGRLDAIGTRGGQFVVVDPARTKTADRADSHLAIRPGTDALLLASIATELVAQKLDRPDAADRATLHQVVEALGAFTPESTAEVTGLAAADVQNLVAGLANAERPCVYGRLGTTVNAFGTTTSWLTDIVNALLGALDAPGGAMFPLSATGSANTRGTGPYGPPQSLGRRRTAVSDLPVELGEHPVAALAEEIEAGNIDTFVTVAGNPVLSCPDSTRLDAAFASLEFMVSVDCYLNETTRHADVILPPPSPLQRSHFDIAFANLQVRNVANYSPAVLPLEDGEMAEWEIMCRFASLLAGGGAAADVVATIDARHFERLAAGAVKTASTTPAAPDDLSVEKIALEVGDRTGPERLLDVMVRSGPYGDWFGHREGLTLDKLIEEPHGIDFGPLEPRLPDALATPSGRPEFAHPDLMADIGRLAELLETPAETDLLLINRRTLRSNNSWMHNLEILVKGKPRCTMQVHPDDADRLGLASGGRARVTSSTGTIEVPVIVDDCVRAGVVSIPHGWGHDLDGTALGVAQANPGVNVNVLTPTDAVDPLSGTSQLTGIPVTVAPA